MRHKDFKPLLIVSILLTFLILSACTYFETATPEAAEATEAVTPTLEPTQEATIEPTSTSETTSVSIEEIQNIEWNWTALVEIKPAAQSVVPDSNKYTLILWEDKTFAFKADCNVGSGSYEADGSDIQFELGLITLAECGPDSLYDQYLDSLNTVESFALRDEELVLNFRNETGYMDFANGGKAEKPDTPPTCDAGIDPVSVELDTADLPYSYLANCILATPYDDSQPLGPTGLPDHIQVNFSIEDQEAQPNDPIIYMIPIEDYQQLWDQAGDDLVTNSIDQLQQLLEEQPDPVPTTGIPILPNENVTGESDIQVQGEFLDITTGSGVRFVTRFLLDVSPVTRDEPQLYYTFQGVSSDGLYLISFFYPVTSNLLPTLENVSDEELEQINSDPEAYLEAKISELNELSPSDWEPDLTVLDEVIDSLLFGDQEVTVEVLPPQITNINWQWGEIIDNDPLTQAVVPDPSVYILVFFPNGNLSFQADCNSGSGSYTVRNGQLTLELGPTTLADCGPDSLSAQYLALLEDVVSFSFESNRLVLVLEDGRARMIFYNGGTAITLPKPGAGTPTATAIDAINIRSGPGTEYPSFGVVQQGTTFEVTGVSEDTEWWVVQIPSEVTSDEQGWVSAEFVETTNTEEMPTVPNPPLVEVNLPRPEFAAPTATAIQSVNVRSGPGTQYPSYGIAPIGATAQIVGISEDGFWWVIKISADVAEDEQGWVNASYVQVEDTVDIPVIPAPPLP